MCTSVPICEVLRNLVFYRLTADGLTARIVPIDGAIGMFIDDVTQDQLNQLTNGVRKHIYWEVYSHIHALIDGDLFAIELITPYHSETTVRGLTHSRVQGGHVRSTLVSLDHYCHSRLIEDQQLKAAGRRRARRAIEQVTMQQAGGTP